MSILDHRRPAFSFLLQIPSKKGIKIEFFEAKDFYGATDEPTDGRYRIRISNKWFCLENKAKHEYFFTDLDNAFRIIRREFGIGPKVPHPEIDPSRFPKGCTVRAKVKGGGFIKTFTTSDPFLDQGGTWRAFLGGGSMVARNPDALECLELLN